MNICRKVTYLDGSVISSHAHGQWIPIPASCISLKVLDQLADTVESNIYIKEEVAGQGTFEYLRTV